MMLSAKWDSMKNRSLGCHEVRAYVFTVAGIKGSHMSEEMRCTIGNPAP
jgi:hypothetical protein